MPETPHSHRSRPRTAPGTVPGTLPGGSRRRSRSTLGPLSGRAVAVATALSLLMVGTAGAQPGRSSEAVRADRSANVAARPATGTTTTTPAPVAAPVAAPPATIAPPPPPPPPPEPAGAVALREALRHLGTPYRYGGSRPGGFDCSGLTMWSYAAAGVALPRTSGSQMGAVRRIGMFELRAGDLVWYGSGHVGMYAGNGMVVHSPRSGRSVELVALSRGGMAPTMFGRVGA